MWTKSYALTLVATFAFWFNAHFLFLVLPLYMQDLGFQEATIGLVFGIAAPATIVARLLSGRAIDRRGGYVFVVLGMLAWALTTPAFAVSTSLALFIVYRLIQGLGLGVFTNAALGYVSYSIKEQHLGKGIGWWSMASPLNAALAPIVAAYLLTVTTYQNTFLLAGGFGLVGVMATLLLPRSRKVKPGKPTARPYAPQAVIPGLFGLVVGLAAGSFAAFAPVFARDIGIGNVGLYLTVYALGSLTARFLSGPLSDRRGRVYAVLPGLFFPALAMTLMSVITHPLYAFIVPLLFGLGTGSGVPGLVSWAVERCAQDERATAGGTLYSFYEVGLFVGTPIVGVALQTFGYSGFFVVAALLWGAFVAYLVQQGMVRNAQTA